MQRYLPLAFVFLVGFADFSVAAAKPVGEAVLAELVLSGPSEMPLFRKGRGVTFHATLVNRSDSPLIFVPPHKDWLEERQLEWQAVDAKGRWIDRQPNWFIWCDVHGVMRAERRDFIQVIGGPPRQIHDSDVVILQRGERYEIEGLADPSFALNFLKRGIYQISLSYNFEPSRYELAKGSKNGAALKNAEPLSLNTNTLSVNVN